MRGGQSSLFCIKCEAVNHRIIATPRQKTSYGAAAAAQIQHLGGRWYVATQNGKGGVLAFMNFAVIHVQGRGHGVMGYRAKRAGLRSSAANRSAKADAKQGPLFIKKERFQEYQNVCFACVASACH